MLHHLIMGFAALTRFTRKWLIRLSLVIFLIGMNIATLVSNTVYDAMSRMVWGMVEIVSDRMAERRPKNRAEMDAEISRSRAQADAAKAEADAAKSQAARSTSSLDEANARNRSMATELEMAKADASTARGEAARMRADLDAAKREVSLTRAQIDEAHARNRSLTVDIEAKDRRAIELAAEVDATRKGRQQAIDAASGLRTRVVNSIRRDASTEAIGAVPFIGTAVFLGSVAYELNDACQQLRELETLDAALRGKDAEPLTETMCLMSYEDMVAALTGQDRAYAKCVSDRIATNDLNPPSCSGYEPALPTIADSISQPSAPALHLPRID
jgi:hypothetical protein